MTRGPEGKSQRRRSLLAALIYISGLVVSYVAGWAISAYYDRLLLIFVIAIWVPFLITGLRNPERTSFARRKTLAGDLAMTGSGVLLSVGVAILAAYVNAGEPMPTPIEGAVGGALVVAGAAVLFRMLFFTRPRDEGDRSRAG